ncbi:hypothetical protein H5410_027927, partial [Solanum commersonii]
YTSYIHDYTLCIQYRYIALLSIQYDHYIDAGNGIYYIACQSQLLADDCYCEICTSRKGFVTLQEMPEMEFEVNTCYSCSHWNHTDCSICDK